MSFASVVAWTGLDWLAGAAASSASSPPRPQAFAQAHRQHKAQPGQDVTASAEKAKDIAVDQPVS